ncbi:MAG: gluconate 2-dehydrogenase subunit 3 family protein [Candidatus Acidiferrum sp.]|jgi:gluconate 2-dehydrogenase gamma chain
MKEPTKPHEPARRQFLLQATGAAGAAWFTAQWPAIAAAAQHAHQAASAKTPAKFEVLSAEQAREVEAIASQIIPTDDLPGAKEAGVVYFIDHGLKTFASDSVPVYEKGLAHLNQLTTTKYPGTKSFADASAEQQEALLIELTTENGAEGHRRLGPEESSDFFETIRMHVIFGFLADPSAGGNRDYAGWKVAGRDSAYMFSPPFGFYDKNYPGWLAAKAEAEKK